MMTAEDRARLQAWLNAWRQGQNLGPVDVEDVNLSYTVSVAKFGGATPSACAEADRLETVTVIVTPEGRIESQTIEPGPGRGTGTEEASA